MAGNVTIGEAKTHFSQLVRQVEAGEEIVIRRGSRPVARLVPLEERGGVRGFGSSSRLPTTSPSGSSSSGSSCYRRELLDS